MTQAAEELSGDALHAHNIRQTPLDAKSVLDVLAAHRHYYGDGYYRPLTDPVDELIKRYYKSLAATDPAEA